MFYFLEMGRQGTGISQEQLTRNRKGLEKIRWNYPNDIKRFKTGVKIEKVWSPKWNPWLVGDP